MGERNSKSIGQIGWIDLTVADAANISAFYQEVAGWQREGVDMGGYEDFSMKAPGSDDGVAGICHARGGNTGLPAQWLIYINVADLEASMARCRAMGGEILAGPKGAGSYGHYCVIRDPAGAVAALFQQPAAKEER